MVIGLATVALRLPAAASLKDRRRVVRSVVDRVRSRFNVSVGDIGEQDVWTAATLAIACVSTDAAYAHGLLERVVHAIEAMRLDAEILDYEIEML